MSLKNRIILVTPLISTIIFLTIGFITGVWNPTWAVFFLIIIVPALLDKDFVYNIYPIAVVITYVTLGIIFGIWHPLWVIFLTIPVYYVIFGPMLHKKKKEYKGIKVEFVD